MAIRKTKNLLPSVFQTVPNEKFLAATLDNLVTEPNVRTINGYIGRKHSPQFNNITEYVREPTVERADYQVEPSVVVSENENIDYYLSYSELLQSIKSYGGVISNPNKLFSSEYYSYDPNIDFDKLVNYSEYYWLPNGPESVLLTGDIDVISDIIGNETYTSPNNITLTNGLKVKFLENVVPSSYANKEYYVEGVGSSIILIDVTDLIINKPKTKSDFNPESLFVLESTATLNLTKDQITIQSSGNPITSNILSGFSSLIKSQTYLFDYPYRGGLYVSGEQEPIIYQSGIIGITSVGIPIRGTTYNWTLNGINGITWTYNAPFSKIITKDNYGGEVDNSGSYFYRDASFILSNAWANTSEYSSGYVDSVTGHSKILGFAADGYPIYGPYGFVDPNDKTSGVERMRSSYVEILNQERPIDVTSEILIINSNNVFTLNSSKNLNPGMKLIKVNDVPIDEDIYILDNSQSTVNGKSIFTGDLNQVILNKNIESISVSENDLLSFSFPIGTFIEDYQYQHQYGTLDEFNGRYCVTPEFPNGTYAYFMTIDSLGTPVYPYVIGRNYFGSLNIDTNASLTQLDYITINRASVDKNLWSRSNRWFHKSVILLSDEINKTSTSFLETSKAKRPIIEFNEGLQLFNFGKYNIGNVDLIDLVSTNGFLSAKGQTFFEIDGVPIINGMRIVFANDNDLLIKSKIWEVSFGDNGFGTNVIDFNEITEVKNDEVISVFNGIDNVNKSFWFYDERWQEGQQKSGVNQEPKFDVFDQHGISFSNTDSYPPNDVTLSFSGTKLFSYSQSEFNNIDPYLNLRLVYKNVENIGDIQFTNNFELDTFSYFVDNETFTKNIYSGFLKKNNYDGTSSNIFVWTKVNKNTTQEQIVTYLYDDTKEFILDIPYEPSLFTRNLKVTVNFEIVNESNYVVDSDNRKITFNSDYQLNKGDKIDILFYSRQSTQNGFYTIPKNLEFNSLNEKIDFVTLGEMRSHFIDMSENNLDFSGNYVGSNNSRDIKFSSFGGKILKHSASLLYPSLFLGNNEYNFIESLEYAKDEYTKFKNKFLTLASSGGSIYSKNPVVGVDEILEEINKSKNESFPWYYSDMVPYKSGTKNRLTYTVVDFLQKQYQISNIFDSTSLSNKCVLVYVNGIQLIKDKDFTFSNTLPLIIFSDNYTLAQDDVIDIVEYSSTDGSYIPETPSKLGLYPKFEPAIFVDNTYFEPTVFIRGHDGSLTRAFNDFRDDLLLELEKRIYNNIKINVPQHILDFYFDKPNKFKENNFSLSEVNLILSNKFYEWASISGLDFNTNDLYRLGNEFTYNFSKSTDATGEVLPGTWRACFEYFYGTQTPHLTPWKMLGFVNKPDWWESIYGVAPYNSSNTLLWQDLENGFIRGGNNPGFNTKFAKPGLSNYIPVTEQGLSISPLTLFVSSANQNSFDDNWVFGNFSPIEVAWRNSSDYPFVAQILYALTNTANYFSYGINVFSYVKNNLIDQFLYKNTNNHITPSNVIINGYEENGVVKRSSGYINWISDFQTSKGILNKSKLKNFINNAKVNLSYRMAGFTDKNKIKLIAEQYSPQSINNGIVIPDEDYYLYLNKSIPLANPTYSAVVIEKTTSGYRVNGYNNNKPYFIIVQPNVNNRQKTKVIRVFNDSVNFYDDYLTNVRYVYYNTEFSTKQQVITFLNGYQRYLELVGFMFDEYDSNLSEIKNFELSSKEFLFWANQNWQTNSTIVLSPIGSTLKFFSRFAVIDEIYNSPRKTKILNQNGEIIESNAYTVNRNDNNFTINLKYKNGNLIALANLNAVQYEHVIIFKNKTQFNDIIYKPELGQRQYRIKIVGFKTNNWTGSFTPEGFIYVSENIDEWIQNTDYRKGSLVLYKNFYYVAKENIVGTPLFNFSQWKAVNKNNFNFGLLNNFSTIASQSKKYYDVDSINLESQQDLFSFGLIGHKTRSYLYNIGINDISQVKFYQGFIKQKGTKNASNALANIENSSVNINEKWAFRVGNYGNLENKKFVELKLNDKNVIGNPFGVKILDKNKLEYFNNVIDNNGIYNYSDLTFSPPLFLTKNEDSIYKNDIKSAGYVNIDDITHTIFSLDNIENSSIDISSISVSDSIWVAENFRNTWDVYKVENTKVNVINLQNSFDSTFLINTNFKHNLLENDVILVKNLDEFTGFYRITNVNSLTSFSVIYTGNEDLTNFTNREFENATIFYLRSLRINIAAEIFNIKPNWDVGEKVWVDNDVDNKWAVYEKSEPWNSEFDFERKTLLENGKEGQSILIQNDYVLSGVPGVPYISPGIIKNYKLIDDSYLELETISLESTLSNVFNFGKTIVSNQKNIIISAPNANRTNSGIVYIFNRGTTGFLDVKQMLVKEVFERGQSFGEHIACSKDGEWLYISRYSRIEVYKYLDAPFYYTRISPESGINEYTIGFDPENVDLFYVRGERKTYVYGLDFFYTANGVDSKIIFYSEIEDSYIDLVRNPGYIHHNTISFGNEKIKSLDSDDYGIIIIVGLTNSVVIYDRSVDDYTWKENQTSLILESSIDITNKVFLNNEHQTFGVDYSISNNNTIIFSNLIEIGSLISVETNRFVKYFEDYGPIQDDFGYSVKLCPNNCSVYVGKPSYSSDSIQSGAISYYLNYAKVYGFLLTDPFEDKPNLIPANSGIRINNYIVKFTGTSLDSIVSSINNSNLPGIKAEKIISIDGNVRLYILSDSQINFKKLSILPLGELSFTSITNNLNFKPFLFIKNIENPTNNSYDKFGYKIKVSDESDVLYVSSPQGTTVQKTTFDLYQGIKYEVNDFEDPKDNIETTFDGKSTKFVEKVKSGALWIIKMLSDNENWFNTSFNLIQQLSPDIQDFSLKPEVGFGSDFDYKFNAIIVGAPNDSSIGKPSNSGILYRFKNSSGKKGWDIIKKFEPKVEIDSILKGYIYDDNSKLILSNLDYIDPVKGKLLGYVEQDLTYKISKDPAVYNNSSTDQINFSSSFHWGSEQVGQVWWDLSTVRYIDYEQGTLTYRTQNWARLFPDSIINVYEWTESDFLPSQYIDFGGDGEPKDVDDSAYVTSSSIDPITGLTITKYYFWVKNKTEIVKGLTNRTIPVSILSNYLENPKNSGIKYFAPISDSSVAFFNINEDIVGEQTIFHLEYKLNYGENLIHSEYILLSEKNEKSSNIPSYFFDRLVDSLSGLNSVGVSIPDTTVPLSKQYGIDVRPRQSMFYNRNNAVREMVVFVNKIFSENKIKQNYNLDTLLSGDPLPLPNLDITDENYYDFSVDTYNQLLFINENLFSVGYKVLVKNNENIGNLWSIYKLNESKAWDIIKVQSFSTPTYWNYVDWWKNNDYKNLNIKIILDSKNDLLKTSYPIGSIIKINDGGNGFWEVIEITNNGYDIVGIENGTIELLDSLWDLETYGLSFGTDNFDTNRFDQNPTIEIRKIFEAIKNDIFVNQLDSKFVELFFVLVYYILNEQTYIDWAFKTSFVDINHNFGNLYQPKVYKNISSRYYEDYFDEIKPYKTTVREYVNKNDYVENVINNSTDFDIPALYDDVLQKFRSPVLNGNYQQDNDYIELLDQYQDWKNNYGYYVNEIEILDSGSGYITAPNVIIANGDINSNATTQAISYINSIGELTKIDVISSNAAYSLLPTITIEGNAKVVPRLKNDTIRKIKTTLTYDRITYNNQPRHWFPEQQYRIFDIINYVDSTYTNNLIQEYNLLNLEASSPTNFDNLPFAEVGFDAEETEYVTPGKTYIVLKDFKSGTFFSLNSYEETASGLIIEPLMDVYKVFTTISLWEPNKSFFKDQITVYNNVPYLVLESFLSGQTFSNEFLDATVSKEILNSPINKNANTRILIYYNPSTGRLGNDLSLLQYGLDYPYIIIQGPTFDASSGFGVSNFDRYPFDIQFLLDDNNDYYDQIVDGIVKSIDFDENSDDAEIIVDGDGYVTKEYSYSPEEMVPGRVFDIIDIKVETLAVAANTDVYFDWIKGTAFQIDKLIGNVGLGYDSNVIITINGFEASDDYTIFNQNTTFKTSTITTSIDANGVVSLHSNGSIDLSNTTIQSNGWIYVSNVIVTGSNTSSAKLFVNLTPTTYSTINYHIVKTKSSLPNEEFWEFITTNLTANSTTLTSNVEANNDITTVHVSNSSLLPSPILSNSSITWQNLNRLNPNLNFTSDTSYSDRANAAMDIFGNVLFTDGVMQPGIVSINGERLAYWSKFDSNNTLCNVRRGANGSSIAAHSVGDRLIDYTKIIANTTVGNLTDNSEVWYNNRSTRISDIFVSEDGDALLTENEEYILVEYSLAPTDGDGLFAANTPQARFIKGEV